MGASSFAGVYPPRVHRSILAEFAYNPLPTAPRLRTRTRTRQPLVYEGLIQGDEAIRQLSQYVRPEEETEDDQEGEVEEEDEEDDVTGQEAAEWRRILNEWSSKNPGKFPALATLSSPRVRIRMGDERCFPCRLGEHRCNVNNKSWPCATARLAGKQRTCVSCYMIQGGTQVECTFMDPESEDEPVLDDGDDSDINDTPVYTSRRVAKSRKRYKGSDIASDSDESTHTSDDSSISYHSDRPDDDRTEDSGTSIHTDETAESIFSTDSVPHPHDLPIQDYNHGLRKGLREEYRKLRLCADELRSPFSSSLAVIAANVKKLERGLDQV